MALSDADLHWIPMNRNKFDQLRKMFDTKEVVMAAPCDKCTSPRIRYTSAENVSALSQIRALLRPVDNHDTSSTSSRSRNTSTDSMEMRSPGRPGLRNNLTSSQQNGHLILDPILCSKNFSKQDNGIISSLINDGGTDKITPCETVGETTVHQSVGGPTRHVDISTATDNNQVNENNINNIDPLEGVNCLIKKNGLENGVSDMNDNNHKADNNQNDNNSGTTGSTLIDAEIHNNNTFLNMVNNSSEVLGKERAYFVNILDNQDNLSEEANGRIMAACGKANLLLTSKFKQYRNLCYDYEKTTRQMTTDDMQGFWELILLQVDDVMNMFKALRKLEENSWIIPKSPNPQKKVLDVKKKAVTPASSKKKKPREKTAAQIARDEARRQMLAAKKEEMRQRLKENRPNSPEIIIT